MNALAMSADAARRPLPWRARPDLEVQPVLLRGRRHWRIKDPVALRYYELRDEEYWLLAALDGRSSLADLAAGFERRFPSWRLDAARIHAFLTTLHAAGLVLSDRDGRAAFLHESAQRERRRRWTMALVNPLAIRFRGANPRALLDRLEPWFGWLLSPPAVVLGCVFIVATFALALTRFDPVRIPPWQDFLTVRHAALPLACIAAAKIVHELAHALACRRAGRDCHELGFMLLLFAPCLYCNVSDTWLTPGKWARAGVAAAGIYAELVIAAVCGWLWWTSQPGLFNAVCFNLLLVCSVGTVLFNANPLLRYDGYFVLSDLLETPNLWERSWAPIQERLARFFLGCDLNPGSAGVSPGSAGVSPAQAPVRSPVLPLYALASLAYRIFVVVTILWLLFDRLAPYRMTVVAQGIALVVLGAMATGWTIRGVQAVRNPALVRRIDRRRLAWRSVAVAGLLAGLAVVPWPAWVWAPLSIELAEGRVAYVEAPGRLLGGVRLGSTVQAGQTLARLSNDDLEQEALRLEGELARQEQHVKLLTSLRVADPEAGLELPAAQAMAADLGERLRQRQADLARLAIAAPAAGVVFPAPSSSAPPESKDALPAWTGSPLEPRNAGCWLDAGTPLCRVGDPRRLEAVLVADQTQVEALRVGQAVSVRLDGSWRTLAGRIAEIARADAESLPPALLAARRVPSTANAAGRLEPLGPLFRVRTTLELPEGLPAPPVDSLGQGRVRVAPRSLAHRGYAWLRRTFGVGL